MIKNVIFDIGRVLIDFQPYEYVMNFNYDKDTKDKVYSIVFEDKRWSELDRGTLSNETYLDLLVKENPNYTKQIQEVFNNWISILTPIDENVLFFKDLKQRGYKLYLLSNFSTPAYEITEQKNPFLKIVDGKVISYSVKTIKPEKQIYEILLSKYNLIPNECVFIDDMPQNIEAAKELGMNGIVFKSLEDAIKKFEKIIGK